MKIILKDNVDYKDLLALGFEPGLNNDYERTYGKGYDNYSVIKADGECVQRLFDPKKGKFIEVVRPDYVVDLIDFGYAEVIQ